MGLKIKRPDPFRFAKPFDTTTKVDYCRKPLARSVVDKYRRSFGHHGFIRELLFEFDYDYLDNFTTTTDLNYNWFPKCCANRRRPPQDLLVSWGNLTNYGLKEQKRYDWSDIQDPRATLFSEYKTVFAKPEMCKIERPSPKRGCNVITWECPPCCPQLPKPRNSFMAQFIFYCSNICVVMAKIDQTLGKVAKEGGYRYERDVAYVGGWNTSGKRDGIGHLLLPDGTRYDGVFLDGYFHGLGILRFPDGSKYEGEFSDGWFHGFGVFWRADGMKHEGEYRGGKIWGLGLTTFKDNSNGFPRCEGYFQDCRLIRKKKCPEIVQRAQKVTFMARQQFDIPL